MGGKFAPIYSALVLSNAIGIKSSAKHFPNFIVGTLN